MGVGPPSLVVGVLCSFFLPEVGHGWEDLMFFLRGVSRLTIVSKYIDFAL